MNNIENKNEQYYLRINNTEFAFIAGSAGNVIESDIAINIEDYLIWNTESMYKSFRLKEIPTGNTLFDYIEEYTPIQEEKPYVPTEQDKLRADVDYLSIVMGVDL